MNIQKHERMAQIKTFSHYLYLILAAVQYLTWILGLLIMVWLWFGNKGTVTFIDYSISNADMGIVQRCAISFIIFIAISLALTITKHLRKLIQYFSKGDIFNRNAISHTRTAMRAVLAIYVIYVLSSLAALIYVSTVKHSFILTFNGNYIFGLIIFGLMYLLLLALEIGCDLNEESELTV